MNSLNRNQALTKTMMMDKLKIKDLLILLCIHPEKGWVRKNQQIGHALIAACLFDLVLLGRMTLADKRISANQAAMDDPLLDGMLQKLLKLEGKKLSWMTSELTFRQRSNYRKQMKYLEQTSQISSQPVEWMGITWGKRYRVNHADRLKPVITAMDRVLIYGREPQIKLRLVIELLGMLGILPGFYPDGELKARAKHRFKHIAKQPYPCYHQDFEAIRRELANTLRMSRVSTS